MKLAIIILILSVSTQALSATLECVYQISSVKLYTCLNTNLVVENNNEKITKAVGLHSVRKNNENVKIIHFLSSAMRRLPKNVFNVFPNLARYIVQGLDVLGKYLDKNALVKGDFEGASKLKAILITGVQLYYIRPGVFEGADSLNFLSLEACGIANLDEDAFSGLTNLKSLSLNYNLIKSLHNDTFRGLDNLDALMLSGNNIESIHMPLFEHVKSLTKVSFIGNSLKIVDSSIEEALGRLEYFYLEGNVCVDANLGTANTPVNQFKQLTKNCTESSSSEERVASLESMNKELLEEAIRLTKIATEVEKENIQLNNQNPNRNPNQNPNGEVTTKNPKVITAASPNQVQPGSKHQKSPKVMVSVKVDRKILKALNDDYDN